MITSDGYAAVPWGKRYVIIYNGEQISDVATAAQAVAYIRNAQKTNDKENSLRNPTPDKKNKSLGRLTFDS
jgi:hypothetical protein